MKPKLFSIMKNSPEELKGKNLVKDIVAGLIVAVVALPLSIALAISSGVSPEVGLITAILQVLLSLFGVVAEFRLVALQQPLLLLSVVS